MRIRLKWVIDQVVDESTFLTAAPEIRFHDLTNRPGKVIVPESVQITPYGE